jgi:hydroxyquinol 1,2-dioxygenase
LRNLTQDNITQAVIAQLAQTPDARLREVLTSLVQHLHAFARDVQLGEAEWLQGIRFLTEVGHTTTATRQEFVLLSDTLGLSMLTAAMNNDKPPGCTEATVLGPCHGEGAPHGENRADLANGARGEPCLVRGRVLGLQGEAVADAAIDVWQADANGNSDAQSAEPARHQPRGVARSGPDGRFELRTVLAQSSPIPHDGPVGALLRATGRHPWRPAHLHFRIAVPGYAPLATHVFRNGDPYLDSDAVFGVRESLVADWKRLSDGGYLLEYDFVLNPLEEAR